MLARWDLSSQLFQGFEKYIGFTFLMNVKHSVNSISSSNGPLWVDNTLVQMRENLRQANILSSHDATP
jgi:hypothetical protein